MNGLETLRDIHLPPEPLLWQTPEAWLAALALAGLFGWQARRLHARRHLRAALSALAALAAQHARNGDTAALGRGLSTLLRDYAAACYPQVDVAGLAGRAWLDFLDAHGGSGAFTAGAGAVLDVLPYRASAADDATDVPALLQAVRAWLEAHPR
ncbi:MAG TPA: DUF4381 domain-containing protein [Noviherbaspirillum sp.]|uniref:DUF4381 domain-containing protein n=1 Tax=Noviherbaspirillum sp. TaxID=1926288 RepID=UPI002D36F4AD|nr:DUF4381 domain-containing protein [Noviherbaspirillum sp.]HYD94717.1 DUF4381 domain-containing protein [Noviherbaspirillum sp.]